jgi:hypothetical protein
MKKIQVAWLLLIVGLSAFGCDKKKEEYNISGFARPTAENTARPPEKKAPTPPPRALSKADTSTPLASYVKLEDGNQLMFMYYALSGLPVDYEKIAGQYSREYRETSDGFKKQDILTALKPRIDGEIEKAKNGRYFIYTTGGAIKYTLDPYDFNSKSFSLNQNIWSPEAYSYFNDNSSYKFSFTNGEEFKTLHVEDAEVARKIEGMISGYKDAKLTIYAFSQDADPSKGQIKAQIVKMQFTDAKGKDLLSK